jgi:integral membrane protein (TIGR00529 family)
MSVPPLVKILVVFASLLGLSRLGVPLGLALLAGGVTMDLWAGRESAQVAADLGRAAVSPTLWLFVVIMALVISLGRFLTLRRNADALLGAVHRWGGRHGRVWSLMAMPSVIGLIPMAAGALMSAPLVEQAAGQSGRPAEWKTAVNYWFRHTWEFWWPLYPGVIMATSVLGMDLGLFGLGLAVFTPFSLWVGYVLLVRRHRDELAQQAPPATAAGGRLALLAGLLVLIVCSALLLPRGVRDVWPGLAREDVNLLAMLAGLLVAYTVVLWDEWRDRSVVVLRSLVEWKNVQVLLTVGGVMIFKSMLESSGLLPEASRNLIESGIPPAVAVAALPLLAGVVTGIAIGYAATSMPLVVGLLAAPDSGLTPLSTAVLAYVFGYVGMMLSPVHLCLVTSREFFRASLGPVYRHILPCAAATAALAVALHLLYGAAGW